MILSSCLNNQYETVPAQDIDVESVLRSISCKTQAHTMHGSLDEGIPKMRISGFCATRRVQQGQSGPQWAGHESARVSIIGALGLLVLIDTNKARLQRLELVLALVTVATQVRSALRYNAQSILGTAASYQGW